MELQHRCAAIQCAILKRQIPHWHEGLRSSLLTQPTNELTRQLLSQSSYYSLEKPIGDLNFVVDVQ